MSVTVPPFDQYQSPLVPLRGLWNHAPVEGDRYVNADIIWLVTTKGQAVQFSMSGNSPVALSQIVAMSVDNSRSGADVDFVFPDSGFVLTVPARSGGVFPVFTNALMFYAVANTAVAGDETIFQILNSMPPPITITGGAVQNHALINGLALANGSTAILPAGVNGTLNVIAMTIDASSGAGGGAAQVSLQDGTGKFLWFTAPTLAASTSGTFTYNPSGLSVRFVNGLNVAVNSNTFTSGTLYVNIYYSTP